MNFLKLVGSASILVMVAACAQQEEAPTRIAPEPVFDKFGGGECEEDYVYVPGTVAQPPQCIPEDECDPITLADGSTVWDCPPPRGRGDSSTDDDDSSTRPDPGRSPTGGTAGTAGGART